MCSSHKFNERERHVGSITEVLGYGYMTLIQVSFLSSQISSMRVQMELQLFYFTCFLTPLACFFLCNFGMLNSACL